MAHACTTVPCPICETVALAAGPQDDAAWLAHRRSHPPEVTRPLMQLSATPRVGNLQSALSSIAGALGATPAMREAMREVQEREKEDLRNRITATSRNLLSLDAQLAASLIERLADRVTALESPDATIARLEAQVPSMTPEQLTKLHEMLERVGTAMVEMAGRVKNAK